MQASSSSVQAASSASEDVLHHDMHEDTVKRLHPEHNEYTGYILFGKIENSWKNIVYIVQVRQGVL